MTVEEFKMIDNIADKAVILSNISGYVVIPNQIFDGLDFLIYASSGYSIDCTDIAIKSNPILLNNLEKFDTIEAFITDYINTKNIEPIPLGGDDIVFEFLDSNHTEIGFNVKVGNAACVIFKSNTLTSPQISSLKVKPDIHVHVANSAFACLNLNHFSVPSLTVDSHGIVESTIRFLECVNTHPNDMCNGMFRTKCYEALLNTDKSTSVNEIVNMFVDDEIQGIHVVSAETGHWYIGIEAALYDGDIIKCNILNSTYIASTICDDYITLPNCYQYGSTSGVTKISKYDIIRFINKYSCLIDAMSSDIDIIEIYRKHPEHQYYERVYKKLI